MKTLIPMMKTVLFNFLETVVKVVASIIVTLVLAFILAFLCITIEELVRLYLLPLIDPMSAISGALAVLILVVSYIMYQSITDKSANTTNRGKKL